MPALDWQGVLAGQPLHWILSGFLTTLWVTLAGIMLASLLALFFMLLRLSGGRFGTLIVSGWVSLFRNTPLLVQLLFWYFAAWNGLPQGLRDAVNADHSWSILPGDVWWFTPEFLCSAWGLGVFTSAFLIEEVESGLRSVPAGQREAALAQGFSSWRLFRYILLPQGLANAWQPVVGQYLNLMKLSSLASGIGLRRTDLPGSPDRKLQRPCTGSLYRRYGALLAYRDGDGKRAGAPRPPFREEKS